MPFWMCFGLHLLQGLSTVLEAGIGAPDPEKLAQLEKEEELKLLEEKKQNEANECKLQVFPHS
jgi:hypothetical protein